MKYILANRNFTLNLNGLTHYKGLEYYEVNDEVANNWWTQAHSTIVGDSPTPDAPEGEHVRGPTGAPHTPWNGAPIHTREAKPLGFNPMAAPAPVEKAKKVSSKTAE